MVALAILTVLVLCKSLFVVQRKTETDSLQLRLVHQHSVSADFSVCSPKKTVCVLHVSDTGFFDIFPEDSSGDNIISFF